MKILFSLFLVLLMVSVVSAADMPDGATDYDQIPVELRSPEHLENSTAFVNVSDDQVFMPAQPSEGFDFFDWIDGLWDKFKGYLLK